MAQRSRVRAAAMMAPLLHVTAMPAATDVIINNFSERPKVDEITNGIAKASDPPSAMECPNAHSLRSSPPRLWMGAQIRYNVEFENSVNPTYGCHLSKNSIRARPPTSAKTMATEFIA